MHRMFNADTKPSIIFADEVSEGEKNMNREES